MDGPAAREDGDAPRRHLVEAGRFVPIDEHRPRRPAELAGPIRIIADRAEVDPEFFEAAGIEIVRGRNFSEADRPDTRPVVIVSEAMARRFWEDGDAVGRLVRRRDDTDPPWLVVGVVSDAKVRTLGEAPRNMVYLPTRSGSRAP